MLKTILAWIGAVVVLRLIARGVVGIHEDRMNLTSEMLRDGRDNEL